MNMKTAYVFLGPPLSGKSTKSLELKIPRFSVRHWFEPMRKLGRLPPIGTFLPDEEVYRAVKLFLKQNQSASEIVFDGFPGSKKQFIWLHNELKDKYTIKIVYCHVSKKEAMVRVTKRKVCLCCDGGADPVNPSIDQYCPNCGSPVTVRSDDTLEAFEKRWNAYFVREREISAVSFNLAEQILKIESNNKRMDLHMHSTFSDGIYTPDELVLLCKKVGLEVISLTDHDSIEGVLFAEEASIRNGINFIYGVEISALFEGEIIHVLGYSISKESKPLQSVISYNQNARRMYDDNVLTCLVEQDLINEDCKKKYQYYTYNKKQGGWKLLNYLIENDICSDGFEYFNLIHSLNIEGILYAEVSTVVNAIKKSGICIVAHLGTYGWDQDIMCKKMQKLYELNVDGFECYHPLNKKSDRLLIKEFCNQYDLIVTGGSDFHGNLADRMLGYPVCDYGILKDTKFEEIE